MSVDLPISNLSLSQEAPTKRYRPKPSSLPTTLVRTISLPITSDSATISSGVPIELILQLFNDRIFLSITQLNGKLGSLLVCNIEESVIDNSTTYNIKTVLGAGVARNSSIGDQEIALREVYVRQIAERILHHTRLSAGVGVNTILGEDGSSSIPTLVVGLALKSFGREEFGRIVEVAMELYAEGMGGVELNRGKGMECPD